MNINCVYNFGILACTAWKDELMFWSSLEFQGSEEGMCAMRVLRHFSSAQTMWTTVDG